MVQHRTKMFRYKSVICKETRNFAFKVNSKVNKTSTLTRKLPVFLRQIYNRYIADVNCSLIAYKLNVAEFFCHIFPLIDFSMSCSESDMCNSSYPLDHAKYLRVTNVSWLISNDIS